MKPLSTRNRRALVAASLRLERRIRREDTLPRLIARRRLLGLMQTHSPWPWISL